MLPLDEDNEGEISPNEQSDIEKEMTPESPSVRTFDDSGNFDSMGSINPNTLRSFIIAVLSAHIALLFTFLGPMLWYFRGYTVIGVVLFLIGLAFLYITNYTYQSWKNRD